MYSKIRGKSQLLFSLLIVTLFITGITWVWGIFSVNTVKVPPQTVAVSSDASLPPEVQAMEAQTAAYLFDRDTNTEHTAFAASQFDTALGTARDVQAIGIFGAAPYTLSVQASEQGSWVPVSGLQDLNLTALSTNWHTFLATQSSTTSSLRFLLTPASGGIATGLKEVAIWVQGTHTTVTNGAQLATQLAATPPIEQGRQTTASPAQGAIGPLDGTVPDDPSDNTFTLSLDYPPSAIKRAYLRYEVFGLSHWMGVVRSINGQTAQGGALINADQNWSTQIESISPLLLQQGANQILFAVPAGASYTYTVKNLRLLIELEDGVNFIDQVTSNQSDDFNPIAAVYDGDLTSGWSPYPTGLTVKAKEPTFELQFDKPTQLDHLGFNLANTLKGTVNVELLQASGWQPVAGSPLAGNSFISGWNQITVASTAPVTGARFTFKKGKGSSAEIREVQAVGSGVGATYPSPAIHVSYPDAGQFYERTAYVSGFVLPVDNGSGVAVLTVDGQAVSHDQGAFELVISKDDVGLALQGDSESWSVVMQAVYPDGETVATVVVLDNHQAAPVSTVDALLPAKVVSVSPGQAKKISHDEASLDIDATALGTDTTLSITPLRDIDLPALDAGMTNVTKGPRKGYRFLPHSMKFKNKIKVTLPYKKSMIPFGHMEDDIKTFYFDEESGSWKALERVTVDKATENIISYTDHFTEMINATVTVPDHPQAAAFNPTQLKDIKAADPGAQINLIEPPQANNMGDARLSYPIEVPPGRQGMEPKIAVKYNSTGGNGWLGLGWDLPMQGVTIDTRWGVPRYSASEETETYLLNGEQLTPVAHRGALQARTAEKIFHTRVEGQFRKIIRHGTAPNNYWWEVFDKNGTRYIYGGDPATNLPTTNSTLVDGSGNVFFWSLREVRDTNNNFTKYRCIRLSDVGLPNPGPTPQPGSSLYLTEITYTGHGITEGPYKVTFTRDRDLGEPRRPDVIIDARGGLKKVTGDLLRKISVTFNGQPVRSYEFKYQEGAFSKTLLTTVEQFDEDGQLFNTHTFEYFDEIRDQVGNYLGFASAQDWNVPSDNITGNLIGGNDRASAIGGSETTGVGGHLYVGFNLAQPDKKFSGGAKVGFQRATSDGRLQLMDINGDGLPDKVFKNGSVQFRPNLFNINGQTAFGGVQSAQNLQDLSREETESTTFGGEIYFGVNVFSDRIDTFSTSSKYISDVNGDGLPDLVHNGSVLFNGADGSGSVVYSGDSNNTPYPIGAGAVATDQLLDDFTEIFEARIDQFPLMDSVRRWTAPFSGQISITAPVQLIQDTSPERTEYQTADGVRVAIQHENSELWFTEIDADDHTVKTPTGVSNISVTKGQRIYFRVQSKFDGAFDQVSWNPDIQYLSVTPTTDVNNLDVFHYVAANDFILTGRPTDIRVPLNGTVKVGGVLTKSGITTDDIKAQIIKNGTVFDSRSLAWNQTGTIDFSVLDIPVAVTAGSGDQLMLRVKVDSAIDATQIDWTPEIFYTSSPDAPVLDQDGNFQIRVVSPFDLDLYPRNNLTAPQQAWTVTQNGTITVVPNITLNAGSPNSGEIILTIKRQGEFVSKHVLTVSGNVVTVPTISQAVTLNEQLYFDLSVRDPRLFDRIQSTSMVVSFGDPNVDPIIPVPSGLHGNELASAFPVRYRGWAATAYNGNRDRATQPINQSLLVVDQNYTLDNARVYPLSPIPTEDRWQAQDDNNWVAAGQMSSSRLGIDFIQAPQAGSFAGARAVDRIGRSRETSVGAGASFLSGSQTIGSFSNSELDYLDLNGDRFPDIIGNGRVQYTEMTGGLESGNQTVPGLSKIRRSKTFGKNVGIGGNPASNKGDSSGGNAPKGGGGGAKSKVKVFIVKSDMPSIGLSASASEGTSNPEFDLMDVNGDGLPDRVIQSGGNLSVQLNLGYKFGAPESWGAATISDGESAGFSGGLGYNDSIYGWSGGLNISRNDSRTKATLVDINGDGLLDRVTPAGNALSIGFNDGNGFAPNIAWQGALRNEITTNTSDTQGGGFYFTIGIGPLCLVGCYVIINPGVNFSLGMGRQEVSIQDIDGDDYPDHLFSERDSELRVASNRTGRTNLLKHVSRPLGATIDIEYQRSGNTFEQPQNRWVMNRVEVFDGFVNDGVDTLVNTYRYEEGFYNREEREFYGFKTVVEEHRDNSNIDALYRSITRSFLNDSYYEKGLLKRELTADALGNKFLETENTYLLRDINTGNTVSDPNSLTATVFSGLARTDRRFFEGQPTAGKSTNMLYDYDALGNIVRYFDSADVGAQDDVEAIIGYFNDAPNYIVGKANSIVVTGNGVLMRQRAADFDIGTGNLRQLRQLLAGGSAAVTDMSYDPFGNLIRIAGPTNLKGERYTLDYVYDPTVNTYVTQITDSFGYVSTASYNLNYGKVENTTDINNQPLTYSYDKVGRVDTITGPYQAGTAFNTIKFTYNPQAVVPSALTRHIDTFRDINDPIETVLFADGLKRVLQTKKDATIHTSQDTDPQHVMIASGRLIFDHVGRTVQQFYPVTEGLGNQGVFNFAFDSVQPTVMTYDILDRNTKTTIPDNTSTSIAYGFGPDRNGQTQFETIVTDANGIQKRNYRDVRELITSVKEFNKGGTEILWTSYVYDPLKQITQVADDHNNLTTIQYDNFGRRTVIDNPDTGKTETVYDLASNVTQKITANLRAGSKAITYDYDFSRLKSITYPDFTANNVTYTYGAPGAAFRRANRIVLATDESGTEERFYGPLGEITKTIKTVVTDTTPNQPEVYTTEYLFDTWNRLQQMTYPDGEVLTYNYDAGGLLKDASGVKARFSYSYIKRLEYDKFEQRQFVEAGNNVRTTYNYDPLDRRLATLKAGKGIGSPFQDLTYTYDDVGNILRLQNLAAVTAPSQMGGATDQNYSYDDLYRLTGATGTFDFEPNKQHRYNLSMVYNTIHNITFKGQLHELKQPSGTLITQKKTSYNFNYDYTSSHPHAPTHLGNRTYTYDANGNQLGWTHDKNGTRRNIVWDEENRIQSIFDNGHEKTYKYNDAGERVIKRGPQGETVYVNQYFTIRNKEIGTKHVFAGTTRVVSKLMKQDKPGANPKGKTPKEKDLYFYHPDHLGSTGYVTDTNGKIYQHIEYFPFGETWVEQASNTQRTPYLFSAKELDEETGLYYFGARYFDPRASVWQSADAAIVGYLPFDPNQEGSNRLMQTDRTLYQLKLKTPMAYWGKTLPGRGGVFNPGNLNLYSYGLQNPLVYTDPTGKAPILQAWKKGFDKASTAGKIGLGFLAPLAYLAHVSVNTLELVAATVFQPFSFIDFTWGAPNTAAGLVAGVGSIFLGAEVKPDWGKGARVVLPPWLSPSPGSGSFGFSLGPTLIGSQRFTDWKHEYGHTWQSRVLGPLYLPVIALPSIISAATQSSVKHGKFWTETWADKWSGWP